MLERLSLSLVFFCLWAASVRAGSNASPCLEYGTTCDGPGNDGTCDPNDDFLCNCVTGYVRDFSYGGHCAEGMKCEDGVMCDDWIANVSFEVCTVGHPTWCKCAEGYTNEVTSGKCVAPFSTKCSLGQSVCIEDDGHDGTCMDAFYCNCKDGYMNLALTGLCVKGTECSNGKMCHEGALYEGSFVCITGNKEMCQCAPGYFNHIVSGECVRASECDDGVQCNDETLHDGSGLCAEGNNNMCRCAEGRVHNSSGSCVLSTTCDSGATVCVADDAHDGTCMDGFYCNCNDGYVNGLLSGLCAEGMKCEDGVMCDDWIANVSFEVCTVGHPTWCKCAEGYTNEVTSGKCVAPFSTKCSLGQSVCIEDDGHDGTCMDAFYCNCKDGYMNLALTGLCVKGTECSNGKMCHEGALYEGSFVCITGNKEMCQCAPGYFNHIVSGECVRASECDDGVQCNDETLHDGSGLCAEGNNNMCRCAEGHVHNSSGSCALSTTCGRGATVCVADDAHDGTCMDDFYCNCNDGYVNEPRTGLCEMSIPANKTV
eukprot:Lankesteria_metandrocarpae@DN5154_c0_g1_i1.p1